MRTLISFLGKSKFDPKTGYRNAQYQFQNGEPIEVPYFGLALLRWLKPDRIVILGTSGSMWDALLDNAVPEGEAIEIIAGLRGAIGQEEVSQDLLNSVTPMLAQGWGLEPGQAVLQLIPYARTEAEQVRILSNIAEVVGNGDTVFLDVTHGFRHLPMLVLLASLYLEIVKGAQIGGIYYGALEMTSPGGPTPVLDLSGMLRIARWLNAVTAFDHSGDYAILAGPLADSGLEPDKLRQAAFFERIQREVDAANLIKGMIPQLSELPPDSPAGLFIDSLNARLAWSREQLMYRRQATLAQSYLERRDYTRAVIFGFEAIISELTQASGGDVGDYSARDAAKEAYEKRFPHPDNYRNYLLLRHLRNTLAHGSRPVGKRERAALVSEQSLEQVLRSILPKP